jgi:hypothetical protein
MPIINNNIIVFPHLEWTFEFENESLLYNI